MKKYYYLLFLVTLFVSGQAMAQDGTVQGIISDSLTQQGAIGASIYLKGTTYGSSTDANGKYLFKAPAGNYTLVVSAIGYKAKEVADFNIAEGEEKSFNLSIAEDVTTMNAVLIEAKLDKESEAALVEERKQSNLLVQNIGAEQMAKVGAGDAGEALKKLVGLSIVGSKYVYVRGLGDRYNSTYLNGFAIASPDPDKRVIPLDIFPTDIIKSMSVVKAFSPNLYGDFSGGAILIETKDYPEDKILKIGLGTSYNSQSTFKDFMSNSAADGDILGYNKDRVNSSSANNFKTSWNPVMKQAPLNKNFNLLFGNSYHIGSNSKIGVLASANFGDKYIYEVGNFRNYRADGTPNLDYAYDNYAYETNKSALGNIYFELNPKHSFTFNTLYTHTSSDAARDARGKYYDYDFANVFSRRFTYRDYGLLANQLSGKHKLSNKLRVDWGISRSQAASNEPDRRQLVFFYQPGQEANTTAYALNTIDRIDNHRFFYELKDTDFTAKAATTYIFKENEENEYQPYSKLTVGVDYRNKQRDFNSNIYAYVLNDLASQNPQVDVNNMDAYINSQNLSNGLYSIQDRTQQSDKYKADLRILSGYASFDHSFIPNKLQAIVGVRAESALQGVDFRKQSDSPILPVRRNELDNLAILPTVTLRYDMTEQNVWKLSASRTISRPDFKEVSEFQYRSFFAGYAITGNPNLDNGFNYNADIRFEKYLSNKGIFSVGVYGKQLQNPITPVIVGGAVLLQTFVNSESATVAGVELEFGRKLDFIPVPVISDLTFNTNISFNYSQVVVGDKTGVAVSQTSNDRPLIGASPYLINADLTYTKELPGITTNWTLAYNIFGRRLSNIGANELGDIYELPVNTLNLSVRNEIGESKKWGINFTIKNLLNPEIRTEQEVLKNGELEKTVPFDGYKLGATYSLGVSYNIFAK